MANILDAARVLMAHSLDAARDLGPRMGGSPIFQQIYNRVATTALGDASISLTPDERALVAQFITAGDEDETIREFMLRVRLTRDEQAELQRLADVSGMKLSAYVRSRLFG